LLGKKQGGGGKRLAKEGKIKKQGFGEASKSQQQTQQREKKGI